MDEGSRDSVALAAARVDKMLSEYVQPALDLAIDEALKAYIAKRKSEMPDAFI